MRIEGGNAAFGALTFAERLRSQADKKLWMMGGGEIIGSFLDEGGTGRAGPSGLHLRVHKLALSP